MFVSTDAGCHVCDTMIDMRHISTRGVFSLARNVMINFQDVDAIRLHSIEFGVAAL